MYSFYMDLMCLRSFISIMHIVILKDKLFYVQENSKGFIKANKKQKMKKIVINYIQ